MLKDKGISSVIILIIVALVIVGVILGISLTKKNKPSPFSQQEQSTSTKPAHGIVSPYTGFMKLNKGAWTEVVTVSSGKEFHQKTIYLGQEKVEGELANRIEFDGSNEDGSHYVVQLWITEPGQNIVKAASKGFQGTQDTYCITKSMIERFMPNLQSQVPPTETPKQYDPHLPDIDYGTYTTPTGKTVSVAKFKGGVGEGWVSSQVPFGLVKTIDTSVNPPQTTSYLYDFGVSGGQPQLSDEEISHCKTFNLPSF